MEWNRVCAPRSCSARAGVRVSVRVAYVLYRAVPCARD